MEIVFQILITLLVLIVLVIIHEFGHFLAAKICGIRVLEFAIGMGPTLFKIQGKETKFAVRLLPIGGFCAMEGEDETSEDPRAFCNKPVWQRMIVVVAGALMNFILAFVLTFALVISEPALASTTIAQFDDDAISSSQLQVGDKIVKIGNKTVNIYTDMSGSFARAYGKSSLDITVLRNGELIQLTDVEFPVEELNQTIKSIVPDFYVEAEQKNVGTVLYHTFFRGISYITLTYETLFDVVSGAAPLTYISGPIGTSGAIASAAKTSFSTLVALVALISINLGVVNLLPFPALDGGRFVFLVIELIIGRKINPKVETIVNLVGFIILMILVVLVAFKDIFFPIY